MDFYDSEEMRYISLADAAGEFGVSQDYLRFLIFKKKLKAVKIGRNWVTTRAWMIAQRNSLKQNGGGADAREFASAGEKISPPHYREEIKRRPDFKNFASGLGKHFPKKLFLAPLAALLLFIVVSFAAASPHSWPERIAKAMDRAGTFLLETPALNRAEEFAAAADGAIAAAASAGPRLAALISSAPSDLAGAASSAAARSYGPLKRSASVRAALAKPALSLAAASGSLLESARNLFFSLAAKIRLPSSIARFLNLELPGHVRNKADEAPLSSPPPIAAVSPAPLPPSPPAPPPRGATETVRVREVIERKEIITPADTALFQQKLDELNLGLRSQVNKLVSDVANIYEGPEIKTSLYRTLAPSQKIDRLSGVVFSGSNSFNLSDDDIPDTVTANNYLPLSGGTLTGTILGTSAIFSNSIAVATGTPGTALAVTGSGVFTDRLTSKIFKATSTSEASVFPIASTTSFSVGDRLTVSGAGTSTFGGGISSAGFLSSNGIRISAGDAILSGGLVVGGTATFPIASTTSFSVANLIDVDGSGTSTFDGSIATNLLGVTGAGTSTIANHFQTGGNLRILGTLDLKGGCLGCGGGAPGGSDRQVQFNSSGAFSASDQFILSAANFLGIGTGTPGTALAITGAGVFTDRLTATVFSATSTTATSTFAGGLAVATGAGNLGIGTSSPYETLSVAGDALFGGNATSTFEGNLAVLNILRVGKDSTYLTTNGLTTSGTISVNSTTATSSIAYGLTIGTSGGLVGIGTANPGRKLDVLNADSIAQLRISQSGTNYSELLVDSVGDLRMSATGGDIRTLDENFWICSGGACPSGNPATTGNLLVENSIGIATTTPAYKLTINSTTNTENLFQVSTTTAQGIFVINSSGNVGIGTATPGQKLTVAGIIESTTGGFKFPDGTTQTTAGGITSAKAAVTTTEETTSTSYTDLTTSGPSVTVTVGPSGVLFVNIVSTIRGPGSSNQTCRGTVSFALSGGNTLAADDARSILCEDPDAQFIVSRYGGTYMISGLSPVSTTITMKYKANTSSGARFGDRELSVWTY